MLALLYKYSSALTSKRVITGMLGLKFKRKINLSQMSTIDLMKLYESTEDPALKEKIEEILKQRGWQRSRHGWKKEISGEAIAV